MSSKSRNIKKRPQIAIVTRDIFHTALKMMVEYFAKTCNKDILRIGLNSLNSQYLGLKDPLLSQYANGFSSKEIAFMLNITRKTVEVHRYNIMKKLSVPNAAGLVNFFNKHQLEFEEKLNSSKPYNTLFFKNDSSSFQPV